MNPIELKVARTRRRVSGTALCEALFLTPDGYYKKEHGEAVVTLSDAFTITKYLNLTLDEFVTIFFDGQLPFLQEEREDYDFGSEANPLKAARIRKGFSPGDMAEELGINTKQYLARENGKVRISLESCMKISLKLGFTLGEFNAVFFRSSLPFCKAEPDDDSVTAEKRAVNE